MWLSAASLALTLFSLETPKQALSSEEMRAWTKVRPSVVTLINGATPTGLGVCVDRRGYFLAHQSAVSFPVLFGRLASGPQIELKRVALDEPTQLVLLQSSTLSPGTVPAVNLGSEPEKAGGPLLAVLVGGPVRAEFVSGEKFGVVNPSRRLMPLNELRFEALSQQIGGGFVFTLDGSLLGVLGATLGTGEAQNSRPGVAMKSSDLLPGSTGLGGGGPGGLARPGVSAPRTIAPVQFGPGALTVAYSVASSVLHRVVAGLASPSHRVLHPAIGVFCKDASGGGAEIISITPGSPSEKAGLLIGDVITGIGDAAIKNQFDVGRVTMRLRIGSSVEVKLRRGGQEIVVLVAVGAG